MNIGDRLRELRAQNNIRQRELSASIGVSINTIHRWECGYVIPNQENLLKLADYFGVSREWLLWGSTTNVSALKPDAGCAADTNNELMLLQMYRKLPGAHQYKILGYLERLCVETLG